ncbi:MAG TPA: helix-turn-helix domain-containing protein, partial [Ktedonobacterales bacterium]|nr:helix-turn-helix domain-containing protein [Ktedonobacterales bacterium]
MVDGHSLTFGILLKRYRRASGLTQEELAERAELSVEAISSLERGVSRAPHKDTVALLADALGLVERDRALFTAAARHRDTTPLPAYTPSGDAPPPLVGREADLALLDRHLAGKGPPVLLFAGEPGIGKSRLLREAVARGAAGGWQ